MKIILKNVEKPGYSPTIEDYIAAGGYRALERALKMEPKDILAEVKKSKLVGRGGAAFPTGLKWEFTHRATQQPKYVICNADEGEPGAFKDRIILENNPHLVLEGMAICGRTVGAGKGFIYIRGEYFQAYRILQKAISEATERKFLGKHILGTDFSFEVGLYRGAGAYICGEETALLDSLEGKKGRARLKPPFPATAGFKNKPTVVNNVETLANIPEIILKGGDRYSKIGSPVAPGTKLYGLSGDLKKPGVYELPTDVTIKELLNVHGGGVEGTLKAVLPSGLSSKLITAKEIGTKIEHGLGAVIAINDKHCMVDLAKECAEFYLRESCGKCTPCREGTRQVASILARITRGNGRIGDLELLRELQKVMVDSSLCGFGQTALCMIVSAVDKFRDEFEEHILQRKCKLEICPMEAVHG